MHERMAGRRAFHLERRVGSDAPAVPRIAHDPPLVAVEPDFHDADTVRVLGFLHFLGRPVCHAVCVQEAVVRVFEVNRQQAMG
jgi:hypothetical protein